MNRYFLIAVFTCCSFCTQLNSQIDQCSFDQLHQETLHADELYEQNRKQIEQYVQDKLTSSQLARSQASTVINIPVVFHLFIKDPAEEVSVARLRSTLKKVTDDFRFANPNVPNIRPEFAGLGADTELEFCLATTDPKGQATFGFTKHYYDADDFWLQNSIRIHTTSMGGQDPWNPDHYLNIYAYNGGSTSYAKRPGSPKHLDGVILGWSSVFYNNTDVISHEIGHWLDLNHTFWNGCSAPGDGIDDTPPQQQSTSCTSSNTCNTGVGDLPDMNENIMSYGYCRTMFTQDQKVAMRSHLEPGGWRDQIVNSEGCSLPSQLIAEGNWRIGNCGFTTQVNFSSFSNLISNYACQSQTQNGSEAIWEVRLDYPAPLFVGVTEASVNIYILDEYSSTHCLYYADSNNYTSPILEPGIYYIVIEDSGGTNGTTSLSIGCLAPTPNDNCSTAIELDVSNSCLYDYEYQNALAQSSGTGCNPAHDMWFTFTNPPSGAIYFDAEYQSGQSFFDYSSRSSFYSGSQCGQLTELFCDTNSGPAYPKPPYTITNLTPGEKTYIQVSGPRENWKLCLSEVPNPPVNDECSGAITLNLGTTCHSYTFSHWGATKSILADGLCTTLANNNDTWFKTVIPPSGDLIVETGFGYRNYVLAKIFKGTCGTLTDLICEPTTYRASKAYFNVQDEVPGTEIYILVTTYAGPQHPEGIPYDIDICVYEPPAISNESCGNAIPITVSTECNPIHLEVHNSKIPAQPSYASCAGTGVYFAKDVWYSFIMPASGILEISAQGHKYDDPIKYQIFSGNCNANNTALIPEFCASYTGHIINSFTGNPNQLYLLRFGMNNGRFQYGTNPLDIDVCLVEKQCLSVNVELTCQNNGNANPLDDTHALNICVESYIDGSSYSITGDININNIPMGRAHFADNGGIGFNLSSSALSLTVTNDNNPACSQTILIQEIPNGCFIDTDSDGIADDQDQCPGFNDALDADNDSIPDDCDDDDDNDGVLDDQDLCPSFDDALDADNDSIPDDCDDDDDNDGVLDDQDLCPGFDDALDADNDSIPDNCDNDDDNDGVEDDQDLCPGFDDTIDFDNDNIPDDCDNDIQDPCIQNDYIALRALYMNTDGENWTNHSGWPPLLVFQTNPTLPIGMTINSSWHGVQTSSSGCVTELNLSENNLNGTIPSEIGLMSELKTLDLSNNSMSGNIPSELKDLSNLELILLYKNQLTGSVPVPGPGDFQNLKSLVLSYNNLTGTIPTELQNINSLEALLLHGNNLTGIIPSSLGMLPNLKFLWLQLNMLTDTIPGSLGDLTNLEQLRLSDNDLVGCYDPNLANICNQLVKNDISEGNMLDATWDDFCQSNSGACTYCEENIILNGPLNSGTYHAVKELTTDGTIDFGKTIQLKAGQQITLETNFSIVLGAELSAEIIMCN